MSSLLDRIASRIDRLRTPPEHDAKRPARKLAAPVVEPEALPAEPMTMRSLRAALNRLAEERARQVDIINGAEAARDRVLDDPTGDDAEILELERQVALARLALDRLKRLEEEALDQLRPLELVETQGRWTLARDQYVGAMQEVHAAMQEYERAANRAWAIRSAVFNQVGASGWDDVVPRLPHLAKAVPSVNGAGMVVYDSHQYRAEALRFSTLMIGGPVEMNNYPARLTRYVNGQLDLAEVEPSSAAFGSSRGGNDVADRPVLVRLSRSITLSDQTVLQQGEVVKVRAAHARELVAANRATLTDTLTSFNNRSAGADQEMRELPVPLATIDHDSDPALKSGSEAGE